MAAPGAAKNQPHEGEPKRVNDNNLEEPIKSQNGQKKNQKRKNMVKKKLRKLHYLNQLIYSWLYKIQGAYVQHHVT